VLDGRDIGTVICPDAPVKLYITADVTVRAQRRLDELLSRKGADAAAANFDAVLADMKARDDRDMNRATAPLKPADDAVMLDTTSMSADQAFAQARGIVEAAMAKQQQEQAVAA
jgi:cytidylate kinase